MKLKNLLLAVLVFIGSFISSAQSNLLNAKTPEDIGKKTAAQLESDNDKPLPYGYVHDRDVLMGKMIWEYCFSRMAYQLLCSEKRQIHHTILQIYLPKWLYQS